MVNSGGAVASVKVPFSIDNECDRKAVEVFASGGTLHPQEVGRLGSITTAVDTFTAGVNSFAEGERATALNQWREALVKDPDNYVIRKQIWAVENPERFYPKIDWDWQKRVLDRERESDEAIGGRQ